MQILKSPALLLGFSSRPRKLVCRASGQQNHNERNNYNVRKGKQFENSRRRRGRPAHLRSPYDSPLRDGNRDRLIGLLTERAAKTLMIYLMETNANVYSWLVEFYKKNPIPRDGSWDEISGEAFLRKLLSMPIEEAKFNTGRDSLFDNASSCGVDPRSIAQRIMDIRTQLSEEFVQELQAIAEENSLLLRETLQTSLSTTLTAVDDTAKTASKDGTPVHPELADSSSSSSSTSKDSSSSGGSSSGKGGAVSTPPPSPIPGTPKGKPEPIKGAASSSSSSSSNSSSQKSSSDAADKAAAVAKLNASLQKPTRPGAGSSSNGGNSSSSSSSTDGKVDMVDILAQLRRAMEADVARDVLKMKESTVSSSSSSSKDSPASISTPEAADAADAAAAAAAEGLSPATSPEQQVATPAPVTDEAAPTPVVADSAAAAIQETNGASAAAAAQASIDEDVSITISTQLSNSAVGEAGTYSRMLPKGWGPRLGVGFSRYPRSRNNIVSSANLGALKPGAAGDALSGSAAGEAV